MAVKRILTFGEKTLERVSRKVEKIDGETMELIRDMKDTLMAAPGIGLAAPQIGVLKKVIYINFKDGETEFILMNPKITGKSGSERDAEGCLSYPNYEGIVDRPKKVTVTGLDEKGRSVVVEGEGLLARALCHEIDHLEGVLYTKRARKVYKLEEQ
ncbi:MAG: peptide deformylase [Firmicutes bacterium]|nr:peptide deformylase [Bacillota bacterium]